MTAKTYDQLRVDINASFPDVGTLQITPADLRGRMLDAVDSMESTDIELKASQFKKNPLAMDGKYFDFKNVTDLSGAFTTNKPSQVKQFTGSRLTPSESVSPTGGSVIRLNGSADAGFAYGQFQAASPIDATKINNVGIWLRASPRTDNGSASTLKINAFNDNAGAPNFSETFTTWAVTVPADNKWRLYVLPATDVIGWGNGSYFIPGTGNSMSWFRLAINDGGIDDTRGKLLASDLIEAGDIVYNIKGKKAAMIIRQDDNLAQMNEPMTGFFATAFPSGFTGRSGVSISTTEGAQLTGLTLVEKFGFRSSLFTLSKYVGNRGFMTLSDLKAIQSRGHVVAFQSYNNPTSENQLGVKLLGIEGYNICPAGTITGQPSATTLTWPSSPVSQGSSTNNTPQGFPVYFENLGLPATLTPSTKYWLRRIDSTTFSVHPTEYNAADNVGAIDLSGIVTTSLVIRYWGSAADNSAIIKEYQDGAAWINANGFNMCYAPNQSATNQAIENAAIASGFVNCWTGNAPRDPLPVAATAGTSLAITFTGDAYRPTPEWVLSAVTSSEPWGTEVAARDYIRRIVQYGYIGQDIFHQINPSNIKSYCWMLDEMKWFSDQGLLVVDTVDKISKYVRDSR